MYDSEWLCLSVLPDRLVDNGPLQIFFVILVPIGTQGMSIFFHREGVVALVVA